MPSSAIRKNPHSTAIGVRNANGFTIVELLVTISIAALLMGLLMPGLRSAREGARRIQCGSNLRQIGTALYLYGIHHAEDLPSTIFDDGEAAHPEEMMALTTGSREDENLLPEWDGLGWLIGSRMYLDQPEVLYCPCHHGDHFIHDIGDDLKKESAVRIYCNYHFVGDDDRVNGTRRTMMGESDTVLVVDGMRTPSDINHVDGTNMLRLDCSVSYWYDSTFELRNTFIQSSFDAPPTETEYNGLWKLFRGRED